MIPLKREPSKLEGELEWWRLRLEWHEPVTDIGACLTRRLFNTRDGNTCVTGRVDFPDAL